MPWLAMPYDRRDAETVVSHKFNVTVCANYGSLVEVLLWGFLLQLSVTMLFLEVIIWLPRQADGPGYLWGQTEGWRS